MKKFDVFNLIWCLPLPLMLGIIVGFGFDFKLGIFIGLYSYFNEIRNENMQDNINYLLKKVKALEDGKQG